jgi:D-glycero-D-manno-heptose 1,7-bisphosphate phosphatase
VDLGLHRHISRLLNRNIPGHFAVFLDRDGVLTEDIGYLHRPEEVRFLPGAIEAVTRINQLGFPIVMVTNQSGIGRGYYTWREFEDVQARIREGLAAQGAMIDGEYACGYYSPSALEFEPGAAHFRKPEPGMLELAASEMGLNLAGSWLIGDKPSDIEAAIRAGLRGAIHVATGYGTATRAEVAAMAAGHNVQFADSLAAAVSLLRPS